jgi:hypothetical protein
MPYVKNMARAMEPGKNGEDTMSSVHLQGIGQVAAKPANTIKVGEVLHWNHGYSSDVVEIEELSKCYLLFHLKSRADGVIRTRRMKKSRLVACSQ